ncbi:MAG: hypothetical protein K2Q22_14040, partial [Cytophagales bacterium]|nr:hypothetical protein [Cytophagales bacterium]
MDNIKYRDLQSCNGFYYTLSFCNNSSLKIDIDTSKIVNYLNLIPINFALSKGISIAAATTPKRRCRSNYTNVVINTPQNGQVAKITYPHEVVPISSIPPWNKKTGDTLFYSSIVPNSIYKIQILDSVSCTSNLPVGSSNSIKAQLYLPGTTSITSDLRISGQCTDSIYKVTIVNRGSRMNDSTKYYIYENGLLAFSEKVKLNANDTFKFDVKAAGNCILVRVDEESNNSKEAYEIAEIEGCGGYKEIGKNRFVYRPIQRLIGYATYVINNSNDPNSKEVIPSGVGANNQVLLNTPLTYTLNFQNTGNDTAYAVKIIDSLSVSLNPQTLKVLYSTHNYTTSIAGSRVLFDFPGIKLVDSVHNEKMSHGYIKFQINPIVGLTNGSMVKNKASIYFDNNSPVVTNEVLTTYVNKLDTLVDSSIVKIYTKIMLNKDTLIYRYGDATRVIGFKTNVNKLQVTGSIVDTSISFFASNTNLTPKNVGTSFFTLSSTGTYKYYPASTQGQITVIKAGLTVVADSLQKLSNTPNPNFKYH